MIGKKGKQGGYVGRSEWVCDGETRGMQGDQSGYVIGKKGKQGGYVGRSERICDSENREGKQWVKRVGMRLANGYSMVKIGGSDICSSCACTLNSV